MAQEATAPADAVILEYDAPLQRRFNPLRWARREPLGAIGFCLIVLVAFGAAAAPILHTSDPQAFSSDILKGPSVDHPFGTTRQGKDVWSRVLYGGRISLKIGIATVILGTLGGTMLALLTAYVGGVVDFVVGRLMDIIISIPAILFALTMRTSVGNDLPDLPGLPGGELVLVLAISVVFMPGIYRVMRGLVLEQRQSQYVEAAQLIGASNLRIMARHIMPNMMGLIIVLTSVSLPAAILTESSLSFLGVGVPVGTPSWGADLSGQARQFFVDAPWIAIFPGLALSITVFGFNIFGDALRDSLDPRLRGRT